MSDEEEEFECKLSKVESLEEWFSQEFGPEGECRPCLLAPLASLYLGVLEKEGATEEGEALSEAYDTGDILTIAKAMDTIKSRAKEDLRKELEDLDCLAQSYKEEEE